MALITDNELRMNKNKVVYATIIAVLIIGIPVQYFPLYGCCHHPKRCQGYFRCPGYYQRHFIFKTMWRF